MSSSAWDVYFKSPQRFALGFLPTEQGHRYSRNLSEYAKSDLNQAFEIFYKIDLEALEFLDKETQEIERWKSEIEAHLNNGGRVFLGGCGATGRLSLLLESLVRKYSKYSDQVFSFMAGGDFALVRSIEGMEDHESLGARHLKELGFEDGDYFIGFTEGGETPYVLGATEFAANHENSSSFLLFCNPKELLRENIERSRKVIDHKNVNSMTLSGQPMALSGSTRLQATTLLTFVGGFLLGLCPQDNFSSSLGALIEGLDSKDYLRMQSLTELESLAYSRGDFFNYIARDLALTVLTDTTERSPTFSLTSFENEQLKDHKFSWCYLFVEQTSNSMEAWRRILGRPPRPLHWQELEDKSGEVYLGFNLSSADIPRRKERLPGNSIDLKVIDTLDGFKIEAAEFSETFTFQETSPLFIHLYLKMLLNAHSTLTMGRLERYKSNVMTYVRPSNGKLIDRASRYLQQLLSEKGTELSLDECAKHLHKTYQGQGDGVPLVIEAFNSLDSF